MIFMLEVIFNSKLIFFLHTSRGILQNVTHVVPLATSKLLEMEREPSNTIWVYNHDLHMRMPIYVNNVIRRLRPSEMFETNTGIHTNIVDLKQICDTH
jgi:hypothetical protein